MSYNKSKPIVHEPLKTKKGTPLPLLDLKGKPYLKVAYRIVWFREENDNSLIKTEMVSLKENWALFKAEIWVDDKLVSTAYKSASPKPSNPNFIETAETGAIGRALGFFKYGTQHAPDILDDDNIDSVVDTPIEPVKKPKEPKEVKPQKETARVTLFDKISAIVKELHERQILTIPDFTTQYIKPYGVTKLADAANHHNDIYMALIERFSEQLNEQSK